MPQGLLNASHPAEVVAPARGAALAARLPWTSLWFVAYFAVFFTGGDMFLRKAGWAPLRPTQLFLLAALPVAAAALLQDWRRRRPLALTVLRQNSPLLLPLLAMVGLALAWALLPGANWREGGKHLLYPAYNLLAMLLPVAMALSPAVARVFRPAVAVSFVLLFASVVADVVAPGMFAEHMNRAAGLPEDANTAAFLAVLAAALLIEPRRGRRSDAAVLAAAGGVVLCTLSRGGLLLLALLLLAVAMLPLLRGEGVLHRRTVKVAAAGAALLLLAAIGVLLLASFDLGMFGRATTQQRLELIAGGSFVRPQEMRAGFLEQYFELVADAPILGHGTGYSYSLPQGPHNRYLFQWVNFGLLGLGVFLWWLVATYRMFRARGCDAGLLVMLLVAAYSLLNHGVLELRGLALALGLLAGLSAPALKLQR